MISSYTSPKSFTGQPHKKSLIISAPCGNSVEADHGSDTGSGCVIAFILILTIMTETFKYSRVVSIFE